MNKNSQFLRKDREKQNFWDKYKEFYCKSSLDKLFFENFSLDLTISEEENLNKSNIRKDNTCQDLGENNNEGV